MRKLLTLLIALAAIVFGVCSPASAQMSMMGVSNGPSSGGGTNNTALDGHAQGASGSTSCTVTLTTTQSSDLIVVGAEVNNLSPPATISDTSSLTWTTGASTATGSNNYIIEFTAPAASPLSSDVITINAQTGSSFCVASAFGISGYNTGSIFDGAAVTGTIDPIAITTANANDFIYALYRGSTANMTAGSCCTLIDGANFAMTEYVKTTSTQPSLSMNIGTGVGTANGGIVHAVKSR